MKNFINFLFLNLATLQCVAGYQQGLSGSEYLDQDGKYFVSWLINQEEKIIYFNTSAETKGYVGFGLSPMGGMAGADIFIAAVHANGTKYSSVRYAEGNTAPIEDDSQDWILDNAVETVTHTDLSFHRFLNTCDDKDFVITDSTIKVIWALGTSDTIEYHLSNRGIKSVNFYLTNQDFPADEFESLDITVETEMPAEHTTYWCTIHALPEFTEKRHVLAFEPILENPDALEHTHHFIFHRCIAPEGQDPETLFGSWTTHKGELCYGKKDNEEFPFDRYCSGNMVYTWSKGGKRMVFPDHIGYPIPENLGVKEYYALEVHSDNPYKLAGKMFKTGGRIYHTDKLREVEAGLMVIEHHTGVQLTVPPQTPDFVVSGHCSSECTQQFLPEQGITVFNSMLHAHLTGRKINLRHFRGNEELEWVDKDDYFDSDFQQNKPLAKERKVLRGDQLTVECTFDTTRVENGMGVICGLSSHEEMCQAWVFYYPKLENAGMCGSAQDLDQHFELFRITEKKEVASEYPGGLVQWEIVKPDNLAGKYLDGVSKKVDWTGEFRANYQQEKQLGEQIGSCGALQEGKVIRLSGMVVKYPENLKEYVPVDECSGVTEPPTETTSLAPPETTTPEYENCTEINDPVIKFIFITNSTVVINM